VRIYSRRGDVGCTDTLAGERVPKNSAIIEMYGVLDELNSAIGLAVTWLPWAQAPLGDVEQLLLTLQNQLFELGSVLTSPDAVDVKWESIVSKMEVWIDDFTAQLPPLGHFILPGGNPVGAQLHVARTIARRVERCLAAYSQSQPVSPAISAYINRLSDLLFVLARYVNHRTKHAETSWQP
jgi:cob(I)alamin adenosyltransferase